VIGLAVTLILIRSAVVAEWTWRLCQPVERFARIPATVVGHVPSGHNDHRSDHVVWTVADCGAWKKFRLSHPATIVRISLVKNDKPLQVYADFPPGCW